MTNYYERKCPKCGQRLRIPENVGGVTMVCPTCGHKMASDFKVGHPQSQKSEGFVQLFIAAFEFPVRLLERFVRNVFPR